MREAQLRRRIVAKKLGGKSGQESDILVEAPAAAGGEMLRCCCRSENSYNETCKTSMRDQLTDRYLLR